MGPKLPDSGKVAYTVVAIHATPESAARFEAWLRGGHVAAVLSGGAASASVVRPDGTNVVETRYVFASREAFETYLRDCAPTLRAEGLELFGPGSGVSFERTLGAVVEEWGARGL